MSTTTQTEGAATAAKAPTTPAQIAEKLEALKLLDETVQQAEHNLERAKAAQTAAAEDDPRLSPEQVFDRRATADRDVGVLEIHVKRLDEERNNAYWNLSVDLKQEVEALRPLLVERMKAREDQIVQEFVSLLMPRTFYNAEEKVRELAKGCHGVLDRRNLAERIRMVGINGGGTTRQRITTYSHILGEAAEAL